MTQLTKKEREHIRDLTDSAQEKLAGSAKMVDTHVGVKTGERFTQYCERSHLSRRLIVPRRNTS